MRGLFGNVGPWVAWVHGFVGCVGQSFTWVAWVTWVKIFFAWVIIFTWVAWVKYIFVCVRNFFNFCLVSITKSCFELILSLLLPTLIVSLEFLLSTGSLFDKLGHTSSFPNILSISPSLLFRWRYLRLQPNSCLLIC